MVFHYPEAFFLFIPLAFILIFRFYFLSKKKTTLKWSSIKFLKDMTVTPRVFFKWIPFFLQILSVVFIIVALARPQRINKIVTKSLDGIDIMVVLDISFSMMVEDMQPGTRLSSAKSVVQKFIDGLSSDRVGLILFSGESYTKIPLTLDYHLLKEEIARIETSSDIQGGTAIGVAITNASARLRHSKARSRIIILLTDGENNRGNVSPETATAIAKKFNIRIYPIGVGSQSRAKVPIKQRDILGKERTIYAVIDSKINKKLLINIAQKTNGKFYLAQDLKTLQEVFDEIGKLEKSSIEIKERTRHHEEFQKFLNWAVILYSIALFLSITVFGRIF